MAGLKSLGTVIQGNEEKGSFDPKNSFINLAIPSVDTIRSFNEDNFPKQIQPGIINSSLSVLDKGQDYFFTVDGKKCAPGLDKCAGDVDLFGHDHGESAQEMKNRLDENMATVDKINKLLELTDSDDQALHHIPDTLKFELHTNLKIVVNILGKRLRNARVTKLYQKKLRNQLLTKGGSENLQENKYVKAISTINATLSEIDILIEKSLDNVNKICEISSTMWKEIYFYGNEVTDFPQNWFILPETENNVNDPLPFIKQRSQIWYENRKKVPDYWKHIV